MYCKIKITSDTRIYNGLISNGMKKTFCLIIFFFCFLFSSALNINYTHAVYDPLSVPNNKIGIHILFPEELHQAKELVNSSNGDWGYVTIPIQAGDKDLIKWQKFMDEAKKLHLIPIIRLATEGDFFDQSSWRKPNDADVLDFANFLNSLKWPVKNRYVVVFNEVNRADEWEGQASPSEYAQILSYSTIVFKSKNKDFFIISSGMDNAAVTDGKNYNQFDYFEAMNTEVPGIFNQIDGFSSHSYPNPAFSQPPNVKTAKSITSYKYEKNLINSLTSKNIPVFITETGWDQTIYSEDEVGEFFKTALNDTWIDPEIVAVTPFLLKSGLGPYQKFTFINEGGQKNGLFKALQEYPKTKGIPIQVVNKKVLGSSENEANLPVKDFSGKKESKEQENLEKAVKWLILGS